MHDPIVQLTACLPRLRRYARVLAGDSAGADDLVQDTLERGWSHLSEWRGNSDMRAWLFGIMHNVHVDQFRKKTVATDIMDEHTGNQSVESTVSSGLEMRDMQAALMLLAADQREILLLVALEELSYDQIAVNLRIPVGTVMSRLSRAREKLRATMEGRDVVPNLKVVK